MSDVLTVCSLIICAAGLGDASLAALGALGADDEQDVALSCAAGLGLVAVLLGVLGLLGRLGWSHWLLPAGAVVTIPWAVGRIRSRPRPTLQWPAIGVLMLAGMLAAACAGALAPVTEGDSLSYTLPIAQRLAVDHTWRFWPDLARSVYPLSQELLAATLLAGGSPRAGLISAVELVLAAILIMRLARRLQGDGSSAWVAATIALGCPAVALLAASAKEDLLLVVMTAAGALTLYRRPSSGTAAATGLFAGLAAGAKYTGLPVGLGLLACVPFCCGRHARWRSVGLATLVALGSGGLWYAVNIARFGNPIAPFLPSVGHFPTRADVAAAWFSGFGQGRTLLDALLAPIRMTYHIATYTPDAFGGHGNWINPLIWIGAPYAVVDRRRLATYGPLLVVSLLLYVTWFAGQQVARLLLPAAALLSVPAAELVVQTARRVPPARYPIALVLTLSAGIVGVVGAGRALTYLSNPGEFLDRETPHFETIQWMNAHLDPAHDRVFTSIFSCAYLRIPWMSRAPDYQVEIGLDDLLEPGAPAPGPRAPRFHLPLRTARRFRGARAAPARPHGPRLPPRRDHALPLSAHRTGRRLDPAVTVEPLQVDDPAGLD